MTLRRFVFTALAAQLLAICVAPLPHASAQPTPAPAPAPVDGPPPRVGGYLGLGRVPDHTLFLPPPPAADAPLGVADIAIFRATRALENGPRWALAVRDDRVGQRALLADFGCALGIDFSIANAQTISRLLARASRDLSAVVGQAKDRYQRPRPFLGEKGPVCITPSPELARSGSYPSGHAAASWLYALVLAEVDPDDAAAVVARARAFGESRVVCGVHYATDIEGGRLAADAVIAALHGNVEFDGDVAAARAELTRLRVENPAKPDAAGCAADRAQLPRPY